MRGHPTFIRLGGFGKTVFWETVCCCSDAHEEHPEFNRRRTNVQQLTCNIDLSNYFYYLFFSFVLIELKPFVLKGKVPGEK